MLDYEYMTAKPGPQWRLQLTAENLQEAADFMAGLSASNATIVDGRITWSYGVLPVHSFSAGVGEWLYTFQPIPPSSITDVGTSPTQPLTDGFQPLPSPVSSYTLTAG